MISLDDALALYPQHLAPLAPVRRALGESLGQVLAEPLHAAVDLPMFTQSAVDGYAVRTADLADASVAAPATLRLVGEIAAGAPVSAALPAGCAFRIYTGGALPAGADAAARQEIVERSGEEIRLRAPLRAGADTRFRGEEIKQGETIAAAGQRLHSGLLAALTMAGVASAMVRPRPRVALLVSGDEVADAGQSLRAGQIYDANGPLVQAWLAERGYPLVSVQRVHDDPAAIQAALQVSLGKADVVLTTGGVSVGDRDYVPECAQQMGLRQVFWKVAQKPGKPLWFGVNSAGQALLGFPGNPAAVLMGLHIHAARLLATLEGESAPAPHWRRGVLAQAVRPDPQRDQFLRAVVSSDDDGVTRIQPLGRQDSHMLSNLAAANGMAWIRRCEQQVAAGTAVPWLSLV